VRQRRACVASFVDECVEIAVGHGASAPAPCLRYEGELFVRELRDGSHVPWGVDGDLLPRECGLEIRHDADLPWIADAERLGRCPVLPAGAERARVQLFGCLGLDQCAPGAGTGGAVWGDGDEAARDRVATQVGQLPSFLPPPAPSRNGLISSMGAGKTMVEAFEEPISSSVCR